MAITAKLENKNIVLIGPLKISKESLSNIMGLKNSIFLFIDGGDKHVSQLKKGGLFAKNSCYFIGDGDSKKAATLIDFPKNDQNISDFAFALKLIKTEKLKNLYCLGLTGARTDHFLAVLGELAAFAKKQRNKKIKIRIEDKMQLFLPGTHSFNQKGIFSLMSVEKNRIKLTGKCQFPLREWTRLTPLSSLALSNYGSGKILLKNSSPLFLLT